MTLSFDQAKLRREASMFRIMATLAIGLTVICVFSQLAVAAAPLWKGGDQRQALINTGIQLVLAAPALFYIAGLRRARQVIRRVGDGDPLTPQNSQGLGGVGMCLLAGALWSLLISDGLSPAQGGQVAADLAKAGVDLGQIGGAARDVSLAALGLAVVMIGRVWAAAARLKAENDSFV